MKGINGSMTSVAVTSACRSAEDGQGLHAVPSQDLRCLPDHIDIRDLKERDRRPSALGVDAQGCQLVDILPVRRYRPQRHRDHFAHFTVRRRVESAQHRLQGDGDNPDWSRRTGAPEAG